MIRAAHVDVRASLGGRECSSLGRRVDCSVIRAARPDALCRPVESGALADGDPGAWPRSLRRVSRPRAGEAISHRRRL
jgi:hypothetical protein